MKYKGPVRKRVARGAEKYIHEARVMLAKLRARILDLPSGHDYKKLANGTEIKVGFIHYQPYMDIVAAQLGSFSVSVCNFLHGLFKSNSPINPYTEGGEYKSFYPRNEEPAASYGPWGSSAVLVGSLAGSGFPCHPYGSPRHGSFDSAMGTKFSGHMRQIVQYLHGSGVPTPYQYCWNKTHGVYIASDETWWIIEINHNTGVWAWKLPYCFLKEDNPEEFEKLGLPNYWPGQPKMTAEQEGKRQLLADMSPLAGLQPFSTEIGWAFSYGSGSSWEAQNVLVGLKQEWKTANRFKLTIDEVLVEGQVVPSGAVLELLESPYLWQQGNGGPKFPQYIQGGPALQTYNLWNGLWTPPPSTENAPLFVFFLEGLQDPIVVYHVKTTEDTTEVVVEPINGSLLGACKGFPMTPVPHRYSTGDKTEIYTPNYGYIATGKAFPKEPESTLDINAEAAVYITWEQKADWHSRLVGPGSDLVFAEFWEGRRREIRSGTEHRATHEAVIIPFNDREQVYFYHAVQSDITAGQYRLSYRGRSRGDYYNYATSLPTYGPIAALCGCFESGHGKTTASTPTGHSDSFYISPGSGYTLKDPQYFDFTAEGWGKGNAFCAENGCTGDYVYAACSGVTYFPYPFGSTVHEPTRELWAMNPQTQNWESLWFDDTYDSSGAPDPYTKFVTGYDDAQYLVAVMDAFTKQGMISKHINVMDKGEMHYIGSPGPYPLEETDASLYMGFLGLPKKL